jgi:excisionase family DNA binding protein
MPDKRTEIERLRVGGIVKAVGEEMTQDRLLKVDEVAKFLGLARGTIYHLVSEKRLPCVRLSARCLRFHRSELEKFIANLSEWPAAREDSDDETE